MFILTILTWYNLYYRHAATIPNMYNEINLLTPNVNYSGRTAPLTSKIAFYIFIQHI